MNKKISVLAPDLSGGGGTRVYLIAQVLQQLNCQVTVYGPVFGRKIIPPHRGIYRWYRSKAIIIPSFLADQNFTRSPLRRDYLCG
jgi:hypothetical protein